jgi:dTDP-4-amino-4,6-dideoxygalactose transaminase
MLKVSDPFYCPEGLAAMQEAMQPGQLHPRVWTDLAQQDVAEHLGVPEDWVLLTNSCTAALWVAGRHLIGRKVSVPILTWPSTWTWCPEGPTLCDVDFDGRPCGPVEVGVALWGRQFPGQAYILDAAHRFGDGANEVRSGGRYAICYSFGPQKEIPCVRGGCIVSQLITDKMRDYCRSGTHDRYSVQPGGQNLEMAEPFAALLSAQLKHHAEWYQRRQELLKAYDLSLQSVGLGAALLTQPGQASGHLCVVRAPTEDVRELWRVRLGNAGVETSVHYCLPLWVRPCDFPGAWELSKTVLTLPCHLNMSAEDAHKVVQILVGALGT